MGSFNYQVKINDYEEEGTAGYCEYIDCRLAQMARKEKEAKNTEQQLETATNSIKKVEKTPILQNK